MYKNEENLISSVITRTTDNQLNQMKACYRSYLLDKQIPYTILVTKKDGTTITVCTSGKMMFQGANAKAKAQRWGQAQDKQAKPARTVSSLPENVSQLSVLGSDKVGSGSYFGPLTVCATYVKRDQLAELHKLSVRDSKELEDSQIIQLTDILEETIPYKLLILPPEKYSEVQPKYDAVRMKVALHNQTIHLLLKKITPEKPGAVLVDQFTPEANFKRYAHLEKNHLRKKLYFVTRDEQYRLAVAAAFIINRASFLKELDKAPAEAGITLPSGARTKSDQIAARLLEKSGMPMLEKYAKLHFANTEKALNLPKK